MQQIAALLERVDALSLRDWVIAAAVLSLIAAIAWIGRNVGRLIETVEALAERVRVAESALANSLDAVGQVDERLARVDQAIAKRTRNVEIRQDRLQTKLENWGKSWRDSGQPTKNLKFTGDVTKIDLSKP